MVTVGPREKAILCQTLCPLLIGLEGRDVIVELKNDIVIFGFLQNVDCFMNLTMHDTLMLKTDGKKYHFEFFFLQRKNLRYVRIPNNISIPALLKDQIDVVTGKKAREERKKAVARRAQFLKKKQAKNMATGDLANIVVETSRLHSQTIPPVTKSDQEAKPSK